MQPDVIALKSPVDFFGGLAYAGGEEVGGPVNGLRRFVAHFFTAKTFRLSTQIAEVVELADALRSGRSEGNLVGVRIPPSAPFVLEGTG